MAKKTLSKPLKTIYVFSSSTKNEVPHESNVVLVNLAVFDPDGAVRLHEPSMQLKTFISDWQKEGKCVLVSLGGDAVPPQDWHYFYETKSFETFAKNLAKLRSDYGFDGFDLDVEGGSVLTLEDAKKFSELGVRLRNRFPDAIIALTVPTNNAVITKNSGKFWADFIGGMDAPHNQGWNVMTVIAHDKVEFDRIYDFVQIMAYDSESDVRNENHQGSAEWLAHVYWDFSQPCAYEFNLGIKQAGAETYNNYPGIATTKLVLGVTADNGNKGYAKPAEIDKVPAALKALAKDRSISGADLDLQLGGGMIWRADSDKRNNDHAVSTALYALLK